MEPFKDAGDFPQPGLERLVRTEFPKGAEPNGFVLMLVRDLSADRTVYMESKTLAEAEANLEEKLRVNFDIPASHELLISFFEAKTVLTLTEENY